MATTINQTDWTNTSAGTIVPSGQPDMLTQSGIALTTQSGVDLILQPNTILYAIKSSWQTIAKIPSSWSNFVGLFFIADNLGNSLTDNLGNYLITNETYAGDMPPTSWTVSEAS